MAGALTTKSGAALLGGDHKGNLSFNSNPKGGQVSRPTVKK
ncbi:hypothetical protein [Liquorilactobacillus uvarum]|nr:hypothetical protein [Liquorilactobacillus uvarum]